MQRYTLVTLGLFLCFVTLAEGQTTKPAEPNNSMGVNFLYSPYQANTPLPQNLGLGDRWNVQTLGYQPNIVLYSGQGAEDSGLVVAPVDDATRVHLKLPKGQGLLATSVSPQGRRRKRESVRTTYS